MKTNKLTLIIDSNWLLISRASIMMNQFNKDLPDISKEQSQRELEDLIAKSINVMLHKFPNIDNVIMIADGGSWRKQLQLPKSISGEIYKGNRTLSNDNDWNYIFGALSNIMTKASNIDLTVSQSTDIEGDDWAWYWSKRLNEEGVNCMIWTSDNDLKQLVNVNSLNNSFTVWYNDRSGLWLPNNIQELYNDLDFFMYPEYYSPDLNLIKSKVSKDNIHYIDPNTIINSKIICGDAGDNILPIIRYKKGNRNYRITERDWEGISGRKSITSIQDLIREIDNIPSYIFNEQKFKKLIQESICLNDRSSIKELIEHNIKLVWLNENTIPDTIIQVMNQHEYKKCDIGYLKSNYRVLVGENDDIQSLFESI